MKALLQQLVFSNGTTFDIAEKKFGTEQNQPILLYYDQQKGAKRCNFRKIGGRKDNASLTRVISLGVASKENVNIFFARLLQRPNLRFSSSQAIIPDIKTSPKGLLFISGGR